MIIKEFVDAERYPYKISLDDCSLTISWESGFIKFEERGAKEKRSRLFHVFYLAKNISNIFNDPQGYLDVLNLLEKENV